ncbi:MAG: hypothetical protein ACOC97_00070 [Myxococcota bacterium]
MTDPAKIPVNIPADEAERKRILAQEAKWTAPRQLAIGAVALGIALALLIFASDCQVTPLPYLPGR